MVNVAPQMNHVVKAKVIATEPANVRLGSSVAKTTVLREIAV